MEDLDILEAIVSLVDHYGFATYEMVCNELGDKTLTKTRVYKVGHQQGGFQFHVIHHQSAMMPV